LLAAKADYLSSKISPVLGSKGVIKIIKVSKSGNEQNHLVEMVTTSLLIDEGPLICSSIQPSNNSIQ
jgi:hypothetical protein